MSVLTIQSRYYIENSENPSEIIVLKNNLTFQDDKIYVFAVMFEKLYFFQNPNEKGWEAIDIEMIDSAISITEAFYSTNKIESALLVLNEMEKNYPDYEFLILEAVRDKGAGFQLIPINN